MYAVLRDTGFTTARRQGRSPHADLQSQRPALQDFRRHLALRRSRHAVRHHGQPLAHFEEHGPHQRQQSRAREYMFLDDSACNLASLNLLKFAPNGTFDVDAYRHAVDVLITAQEILVDNAGYPTEMIAQELARLPSARTGICEPRRAAHGRRPPLRLRRRTRLRRLRHRNHVRRSLSAILPHRRIMPAARASHQNHHSKRLGATTAEAMPGAACPGWYINREPFLDVIRMHRACVNNINKTNVPTQSRTNPQSHLGRSPGPRRKTRLPQLPGNRPRANRNNRLHDGLRHYGGGAGSGFD